MILSKVENNETSKVRGTRNMDESVHEALSFNEEVEKGSTKQSKTLLNACFSVCVAGGYVALSQWSADFSIWILIAAILIIVGAVGWMVASRRDVRPSYRQDPLEQPQADKEYYAGFFVLLCPIFLITFLEGHLIAAVVVFTFWGIAAFWALQSGAMDLSTRNHESNKRASDDE